MKRFIDSNPGLQSRFNRYIEFPDYSEEELVEIFKRNVKKYDYSLSEGAEGAVTSIIHEAVISKDKNFGNARFVRNLFEKVLSEQADRLALMPNVTTEQLTKDIISAKQ